MEDIWIITYTSRKFRFFDTKDLSNNISIIDIAHGLSLKVRFAGHVNKFYSVADHSINVASLVPDEFKLEALLHDASESYLFDMVTPLKGSFPEYVALDNKIQALIYHKFGVTPTAESHRKVKEADTIMLVSEARDLFTKPHDIVREGIKPLPYPVEPLSIDKANCKFLELYLEYAKLEQ